MGVEIVVVGLVALFGGIWGVSKAVEVSKHNTVIQADIKTQCFKYAREIRECNTLD
jgi:hypothetical protein